MGEREREELFKRRYNTNTETSIPMDSYIEDERTKLRGFHSQIDDLLDQGSMTIGNLRDQRSMLKGAQTKLFDIGNSLGMSNTVMRLIEKRAHGDKFILFGGMIIFCILMFLIWKYLT